MNRFVVCLCVLLALASELCCAGDGKPERDDSAIQKVVADGLEAARKGEWSRYADLLHPESLQDYKRLWQPALRAAARKGPEEQANVLHFFDRAADLESVTALKPKAFFVSSMKGMAAQLRRERIPNTQFGDGKIIGTVREGEDQAHVVVRMRRNVGKAEMTQVEVVTLKRSDKEWKLLLPDSVRIMAESFRRIDQEVEKSGPVIDRAEPDKRK
jgi:hypothetical protein